jgi:PIN domain nuclease of toxin-antitoxin system
LGGLYLTTNCYLFDTHALIFWSTKEGVSKEFLDFFDSQTRQGNVLASSITFWEVALLSKKDKVEITNVHEWMSGLMENTDLKIINPSASDMIDSTLLPDHHRDPFDRLLIAQSLRHNALFVTKDSAIISYSVNTFWL